MEHVIKILEPYADAIVEGRKKFEVRKNDRGYNAGDTVKEKRGKGEDYGSSNDD